MPGELDKEYNGDTKNPEYNEKLKVAHDHYKEILDYNVEEIKKARFDHKNCNREFGRYEAKKVDEKYQELLKNESDPQKKEELQK